MPTRRTIMKTTLAAGAAAVFAPAGLGHAAGGLAWKHFPAGQNGFFRAPVLVSGPSEAVLIDGGFTLSDGKAVADAIKATGKKLTTIYISQSDGLLFQPRRDQGCLPRGPRARVASDIGGHSRQRRKEACRLGAATQGERPAGAGRCGHPRSVRRQDAQRRRRDHRESSAPTAWPTGAICSYPRSTRCSAAC